MRSTMPSTQRSTIMRDIAEFFSRVEAVLGLVDERCPAAQARDSGLKGETRPQRRLLEEHHDMLPGERIAGNPRARFHQSSKMENRFDVDRTEIANRNQVTARENGVERADA